MDEKQETGMSVRKMREERTSASNSCDPVGNGLNCGPKGHGQVLTPIPVNGTLFLESIFINIIKDLKMR